MSQSSFRRRFAGPILSGFALASVSWLACSKEEPKPAYSDGTGLVGGSTGKGNAGATGIAGRGGAIAGGSSSGGSSSVGGAGAGGAMTGGAAGEGGAPPPEPFEEDAGTPPQPPDAGPPACDPGTSFGPTTTLVSTPRGRLAAASPDGLVLVWTKGGSGGSTGSGGAAGGVAGAAGASGGSGGGAGAPEEGNLVYYAERLNAGAPFGAPRSLSLPVNFQGTRPALSPDGRTLVVPRKDGKTFGLLRRATRTDAFAGVPDEQPFGTIALGAQMASLLLLDPVYSVDGGTLVFTKLGPAGGQIATCAEKADATFSEQPPLTTFGSNDSLIPTGLSSDGRTLFVYAETARVARALIRPAVGFPFDQTRVLGDRPYAQTDATCETLVYSTTFDGEGEIVATKRQ